MRCSKVYIVPLLLFLTFTTSLQAQESSFDAMVNDKMMGFTQRDFWQKPDSLLAIIQIEPAEHITEIGADDGYFTLKLAHEVGPDGKLTAFDADDAQLNVLRLLKRYYKLEQLKVSQNRGSQLNMEPNSQDKIVMMGTYHTIKAYEAILKQCLEALKPGGKVFIIDRCEAKLDNDQANRKKLFKKQSIRPEMAATDLENAGLKITYRQDKFTVQNGKVNWFVISATKQ